MDLSHVKGLQMLNNKLQIIPLGLALLASNFQVFANTTSDKQLPCYSNENSVNNSVIKATVIKRAEPKYPINAAKMSQEGWVRLSFVIKEDGSVDLPIVEDSSGIKSFEKSAMKAVKTWKFDPATRAGKTIEQCQNSVQMNFKMGKTPRGASRKFVRKFRKIQKLINDNQLKKAKDSLDEFQKKPRQNFYEDKFFFSLYALYFQAMGDNRQELITLNKLIPEGRYYLPKDTYVYSMVRAFQLALLNNELSSVLYYYEKLKQFDENNEQVSSLASYIEKTNALINSDKNIVVSAQINERSLWSHYLARKSFTFANIEGELSSVDIRCDNHFSAYTLKSEKEWKIPTSWGKCKLFVKGEPGAKFNLIELPPKQA